MLKTLFGAGALRAAIAGALVLALAYGAKLYYDVASVPDTQREAETMETVLEVAAEALAEHLKAHKALPEDAGWTPTTTDCGEVTTIPAEEAGHPTWVTLKLKLDAPTRFQYRFRNRDDDRFELLARTDRDCDGLYEVHQITGGLGWTGLSADRLSVQNRGE